MAACDPQLTEAERQAAYQQQRTGVTRALRAFSGSPTIENLIDYINRELGPAVRSGRDAVNDIYLQVADQAPSANPLHYFFAESVVDADPTSGRIRLNQAIQNTATVLRISELNAQLETAFPWLDVMAGSATLPIGVVTLVDARDPGRFVRWDLETMVDMGTYWNLAVTPLESSHPNPFVEGEAVTLGFIPGVASLTGGGAKPILPPPMFLPRRTDSDERRALVVPGPQGLQGIQGVPGPVGREGDEGRRGLPGMPGAAGAPGLAGLTGGSGRDGEDGRNGVPGLTGATGAVGIIGRPGRDGEDGRRPLATTPTTSVIAATVPTVNAGQQLGRQIDSGVSGAAPIALTGAEQGENLRITTVQNTTLAASTDDLALSADTTVLRVSLTGSQSLTGMTGIADGRLVVIENVDAADTLSLESLSGSSSAANRFRTPLGLATKLALRETALALGDSTNGDWRIIAGPQSGRLIAYTQYSGGTSGTHTFDPRTVNIYVEGAAGGGGGGGAEGALAAYRFAAGGQAGESGVYFGPILGTGAYVVGAAGAAGVGTTGITADATDGGDTTLNAISEITLTGGRGATTKTTGGTAPEINAASFDSTAGQSGGFGWTFGATGPGITGTGGTSRFGTGGGARSLVASSSGSQTGIGGNGSGAGGGGGYAANTTGDANGGAGVSGTLRIWEFS